MITGSHNTEYSVTASADKVDATLSDGDRFEVEGELSFFDNRRYIWARSVTKDRPSEKKDKEKKKNARFRDR